MYQVRWAPAPPCKGKGTQVVRIPLPLCGFWAWVWVNRPSRLPPPPPVVWGGWFDMVFVCFCNEFYVGILAYPLIQVHAGKSTNVS